MLCKITTTLLEIWLSVGLLLTTSFFAKPRARAGMADCSKAEKAGRDLLLRAKMMELFESVFLHFGCHCGC